MSPERNDIESIYNEAQSKRGEAERSAYLESVCAGDPKLRARVEALLQAHDRAGQFLETPPPFVGAPILDESVIEQPGTIIGRYKLLEKIGEGGMAVVYMAEQTEPIRRKVALKIIKLGMDTRQVIARFEAERQALALMDHPSIAKVLDAGATETGRPYFVMELVTGVSITEYCDKNSLSTKERLALFLQICNAVQHAHQKGIIHRDIKPSNVMVTHHDGKPVPKVIDFGIAKATNQRLTEKTLFTRYAHIIGTPAYMSPEQAELSDLDIDTRSDIYSLGVLLYELLTGTTPFSEEELRKAGYIEMQRVIREQEPVKPSTKLSTLGETLTDIAKHRNCTPDLLRKTIRGDLDWIVMKSLEKDRTRRYETASGLAEDVRRHLGHEPILAQGPGAAYHLRKFLRRNRVPVLAILAVVLVTGAVAAVFSLWNQGRRQLTEAEGIRHRGILSQAQAQYASADRDTALATIRPILNSKYVGPEAQLLQAGILVDNRRWQEATAILNSLLNERPEIARATHSLLARILRESEPLDAEKLQKIEEHRRQAEALLPETAEAYFLRAMTAVTVKEQLASLDRALQLNPDHYESRRLRAFTYYASRKYDRLRDEALVMTVLRRRDPLGHSLRAVALRELGKYQEAIAAYDQAMALTGKENPQYLDLATQRSETLLRMGDYERAVAEAEAYLKLSPEQVAFRYYLFGALIALSNYDKAADVFREVSQCSPTARNEFWLWATKYVFDALEAGRTWHPPGQEPTGAALLPMMEAEDTYRRLSAKAHRIITDGFSGHWSPDGKKLAFSLGVHGYSGVAIYDPATKETDLLIVPGKDPRWSPDGKCIAFVRDCQALRLEALTTSERRDQTRWETDEEVWVMNADGTEPRRLVHGGWPSWERDSTHVYLQSRVDNILYSISIDSPSAEPKRIIPCSSLYPSLSRDGQRLAYVEGTSLKVMDVISQMVIAEWPVPPNASGGPAWSPSGDELCLGGNGVWIYRFDRSEPARVLSGPITAASWIPDGTKLVVHLGRPYYEVWAADLVPHASTIDALGLARTIEEHLQEMVALYTRRIEGDPLDAYAYSGRAQYYSYLRDWAKADADMRRWSAIVNHGLSSNCGVGGPWTLTHVVDGPCGCQLVVFLERQEDGTHVLRIALGQKGRCEMKSFRIPMVAASFLGLCLLPSLLTPTAHADLTFGEATNLGAGINSATFDSADTLSADGLDLYVSTGAVAGIWVAHRAAVGSEWGPLVKLDLYGAGPIGDSQPSLSADGLTLYFNSDRTGGSGSLDLWVTTRATTQDAWGPPANLGTTVNSASWDWASKVSADGLELYFTSDRPGGFGSHDLYVTKRTTKDAPWGPPANLGPTINSSVWDDFPCISPDGLLLLFASRRSGGYGGGDIYMARRATKTAPWGPPVNLGTMVNSPYDDGCPLFSGDGTMLDFSSRRPSGYGNMDVLQVPVIPIVDFNGDGKVDAGDMALLMDNWGKSNSVCDIGPFAWGDGVVDEQDLKVLMESLMTPGSKASDVPCDVILSWIAPSFAQTCDVYFGTSQEAVKTASRANPQNVLVSQGQAVTTYDPPGLLEFSKTYYWRVDFVISSPAPAIYQGPVLKFTTEAYARPLKNITATASSFQRGMEPAKTVDGSGLDKNDGHSTTPSDMWLSQGTQPNWIQCQFDKVYTLHELWVWNSNQLVEPFIGFGAKAVKIEYSTDGTKWTPLANVPEFAKASGKPDYVHNTTVSLGGVSAKYIKLTIEKGWGATPSVGLSEVRFFYIPDRPAAKP